MQISYYTFQERFIKWLCTKQKPYLKYQTLNDQPLTLKCQYYINTINTSIDIRLQIQNIENKIAQLLDKHYLQYEDEELKSTNIEKIPRIDNDVS